LCYVQGKTRDEAAAELGWTVGTLRGRLDRGRELLRSRLARRGLALSAGLLGTLGTSEAMPAAVAAAAVLSAIEPVATSRGIVALAEGELRAMFVRKLKLSAAVVVAGFAVTAAAGSWAVRPAKAQPADPPAAAKSAPAKPVAAVPAEEAELRKRAGDADRIVVLESNGRAQQPGQKFVRMLKGPEGPYGDYAAVWKWQLTRTVDEPPRRWLLFLRADEDGVAVPKLTAVRPGDWPLADPYNTLAEKVRDAIPMPAWGLAVDGLRFGLRLRQARIKPGDEVVAEVFLRNASKQEISIDQHRFRISDYWPRTAFQVTAPDGTKHRLEKPVGALIRSDAPLKVTLKPGEFYVHAVRLNHWPVSQSFPPGRTAGVFAKPGTYTIHGLYTPKDGEPALVSPPVQLVITEDKSVAAKPAGKLWAAMSVNQPVFREGHDTNLLQFSFTLVNDGDKSADPKLPGYPRLIVNGKELDMSNVPGNGPRDKRFESLPAGDYLLFGLAMGSHFDKPGIYRVVWKGDGYESPEIVFRVLPKK
jgi:hypothetical protein